jgi:hypothetical protein
MSNQGIVKTLEQQVTESEAGAYEVGEQRERNHRYYTMEPLGNEQKGRSHYVSPDVMDAVEGKKALFSETFLSNRQTVKFKSGGSQSVDEADAKTAYAMKMLRKNKHEKLFRDGWHDAFVAKKETVLVDWMNDTKTVTLDVTGAQRPQIQQLIAQQGNVVGVDDSRLQVQQMPSMEGMSEVFMGELDIEVADGYAKITLIEPERFYRDPMATYPEDSMWCTWERDTPRSDLIAEGYDEEQVMSLAVDYRFRSNEEDSSRKAHDRSWTRRQQYDRITSQSNVTSYHTWTWLDLTDEQFEPSLAEGELSFTPTEGVALYKICWAHGELLKYQDGTLAITPADEMPFIEWTEMKISHAEYGICAADVEAHAQKTNSVLKRLIIDNQQIRNNTRYEAVMGALKNPRDLLDNAIGGVIWSRQVGSVAPLAAPELSPLTFQTLQMMRQDSERRDGYSALGKGTNSDAIRYQNADSMVERLTTAGTRRPMAAARDWALNFLIPLCQRIVKLGMENDQSVTQLEVRGRMIPVAPQQWQDDDMDMEAAVALTPQEGTEHAQMLLTMHSIMQQDPQLNMLYGVQQKHALMDAAFDAMGVSDTTPFMGRPDSPEFQQQMQQQQAMAQEQQQKQDQLLGLQIGLAQSADRRAWEEFKWNQTNDMADNNLNEDKFQHDVSVDRSKESREWAQLRHDKDVDKEELKIEKEQKRPASVGN